MLDLIELKKQMTYRVQYGLLIEGTIFKFRGQLFQKLNKGVSKNLITNSNWLAFWDTLEVYVTRDVEDEFRVACQ